MPAIAVNQPFPLFTDADGQPLDDAYIYIGTANQNPVSNPITVYWDEALTIPAAQPIRTNAGYAVRNGSPSRFYAGANYSILVRDKNGSFVYTAPDENLFSSVDATFIQAGTGAVTRSVQDKLRESVSVKDFGAVGDGVTDDWQAITNAINSGAGRVFFPSGTYFITKCLNLKRPVILEGVRGFEAVALGNHSILSFANNTCGIIVHRTNTIADAYGYNNTTQSPATTGADGTIISNLEISRGNGSDTTIDGITHGIRLRARAKIINCGVSGWAGNGIHIQASAGAPNPENEGNANNWQVESTRIINCNHGIYVDGADVNAGAGIHVDSSSNAGWGVWDSSFLGNTWVACHVAANLVGQYKSDNANARSVFLGCYQESGYPASDIESKSLHIGGLSNTGVGDALSLSNLTGYSDRSVFRRGSGVSAVTMTNLGSGYTSAPTVAFTAPTGTQATATATIVSGRIVKATVTSGGGGYDLETYPTVTITGDGVGAAAKATIENGVVTAITITAEGSGYTTATVTLSAPTLTTATGTAVINSSGQVAYVVPTNAGKGYTSPPTISFSGGGGIDAAATCVLKNGQYSSVGCNGQESQDYSSILSFLRQDVASTDIWRLKNFAYTGDIELDYRNIGQTFLITGAKTTQTFGQAYAVGAQWMSISSLVLSGQRRVSMQTTIPPTSGQYARGEIIFAVNPSAGGSPGVVCTTSGVAGSTAVFKEMANLAA